MERYEADIDYDFLVNVGIDSQRNLLLQVLFGLYYLNHILHIYHNDIYYKHKIRNIMVNKIDNPITIEYNDMKITCNNYLSKIIDFGWGNSKPSFRTTEYHDKYFKDNKYISELVIFTFYYLLTIKPKDDKYHGKMLEFIKKIVEKVEKKLTEINKLNAKNFDKLFYKFVKTNIHIMIK